MRDSGDSSQGVGRGGGEKWLDSKYILNIEPTGFSNTLGVACEKKQFKVTLNHWKDGVATHGDEEAVGRADMGQWGNCELHFELSLRCLLGILVEMESR